MARLCVVSALIALLGGCAAAPRPDVENPPPDVREAVRILPRLKPADLAQDEEARLDNVTGNLFYVIRDAAEFERVRKLHGLPPLFAAQPVDFASEMLVGAIGAPEPIKRNFRVYRMLDAPDGLEVQVVSFRRGAVESPLTPYVFGRVPRSDKPVRFFIADEFARAEDVKPLAPGLHEQVLTRRWLYYVYVPRALARPAPLLVLLHGSTTSADVYIEKFTTEAEKAGVVLLAVTNRNGYYWTEQWDFGAIFDAIAVVKQQVGIDEANVFVGGNSAGGHTSYPFALKNRQVFKGFFAMCGRLNATYGDDVVANARDMPVCLIAGEKDELVPLKAIEASKERLEKFGAKVTMHVIAGAGHNLARDPHNMELLFAWLKEQIAAPDNRPGKKP